MTIIEQELVALELSLADPNTACRLCDPDTRRLIAEVRRLGAALNQLMNQPGVTREMLADAGIDYVMNTTGMEDA